MNKPIPIFPIFTVIQDFEAMSWNNVDIKANHRSLYYFLISVVNRKSGVTRFELSHEFGMHGSRIGSWRTYMACIDDLVKLGLLKYEKGANRFCSPVVELLFSNPTANLIESYRQSYFTSIANYVDSSTTAHINDSMIVRLHDSMTNEFAVDKSTTNIADDVPDEFKLDWKALINKIASGSRVKTLEEQLTGEQYVKLRDDYPAESITGIIEAMENHKDIRKHSSVYKTALNWLKRDHGSTISAEDAKPFEEVYREFHLRQTGGTARFDTFQKGMLKNIIAYLKENAKGKTLDDALKSWRFILEDKHWRKLSDFYQRQIKPDQINKNLENILTEYRRYETNQGNRTVGKGSVNAHSGGTRNIEI